MNIAAFWTSKDRDGAWCATGTVDIPEGMTITLSPGTKLGVFENTGSANERAPQYRLVVLKPSREDAPAPAPARPAAPASRPAAPARPAAPTRTRQTPEPYDDTLADPFDE